MTDESSARFDLLSEAARLFDAEELKSIIEQLGQELQPLPGPSSTRLSRLPPSTEVIGTGVAVECANVDFDGDRRSSERSVARADVPTR